MARVYLDHNATTGLRPQAREALIATLDRLHGNPSSLHASGRVARHLLDEARERVAASLGVDEDELVFTSGGTESNNLAVFGALAPMAQHMGLAVSAIEHSSVLAPAREVARRGRALSILPVTGEGLLDPQALADTLASPHVGLLSVMAANNEIGSCVDFAELERSLARAPRRPLVHTDAAQALGRLPVDLSAWKVDLATFSAHKFGGPVGVGVLYRRRGVNLQPLLFGGEQENGLRPGTENVAGIVATSIALELAVREQAELSTRLRRLATELWTELESQLDHVELLGPTLDSARRLPGTLNLLTHGSDGKVLVMRLDLEGLECSAGSACASGSIEPSHVLLALGRSPTQARAGLRLSFGRESTWSDAQQAVDNLRRVLGEVDAKRDSDNGL